MAERGAEVVSYGVTPAPLEKKKAKKRLMFKTTTF